MKKTRFTEQQIAMILNEVGHLDLPAAFHWADDIGLFWRSRAQVRFIVA